jgi:DNA primase
MMNVFQRLREKLPLQEVASEHLELDCSGATAKSKCPYQDHEDNDPSCHFYPDERFWCFGCGRGGDVTDLWAAVKRLTPGIEAALALARAYEVDLPAVDPEAQKRVEERRSLEATYLMQAEDAHKALPRYPRVVEFWEGRGFDEELRQRFLLGASNDGTEAIIPFWHRSQVQGFIQRKLEDGPHKYMLPKKEEFPDGHRPPFKPGSTRGEVFLVEGYLCALSAATLGLDAIAVGGTGINQPQMEELKRLPGPIYIVQDNDEEGEKAARRWVEDLYPKALLCPPIPFIKEEEKKDD